MSTCVNSGICTPRTSEVAVAQEGTVPDHQGQRLAQIVYLQYLYFSSTCYNTSSWSSVHVVVKVVAATRYQLLPNRTGKDTHVGHSSSTYRIRGVAQKQDELAS